MNKLNRYLLSISMLLLTLVHGLHRVSLHPSCQIFLCKDGFLDHRCQCNGTALISERSQSRLRKTISIGRKCTEEDYELALRFALRRDHNLPIVCLSNLSQLNPYYSQELREKIEKLTHRSARVKQSKVERNPVRKDRQKEETNRPVEKMLKKSKTYYDYQFLKLVRGHKSLRRQSVAKDGATLKRVQQLSDPEPAFTTNNKQSTIGENSRVVKRSTPIGALEAFTKLEISWSWTKMFRGGMTPDKQRDQLRLAFGHWERNSNLCFREEENPDRSNVDVVITVDDEMHQIHSFNGLAAHTKATKYIHLNGETWGWVETEVKVPKGAERSAVLETVLQHEVGHLIGIDHDPKSEIMAANYSKISNPGAVSTTDRIALKKKYGKCSGAFHTIIDLQWYELIELDGTQNYHFFYRTLITRDELIWQYSNMEKHPIGEYPMKVGTEFPGFTGRPTAILQLFMTESPFIGPVYVIKGNSYDKYTSDNQILTQAGGGRVTEFGLPDSSQVSSAVFDTRNNNIIFIVNTQVYRVSWNHETDAFTLQGSPKSIQEEFPLSSASTNSNYFSGFDSIYIQTGVALEDRTMYLLKDTHIWQTENFQSNDNNMVYLGTQTDSGNTFMWDYVCNPFKCKSGPA